MIKALPVRPNLEHLKAQAKELLDAVHARAPEALQRLRDALPAAKGASDEHLSATPLALHDAQSVVAREYGFSSWSELRARVESVATLRALIEPHMSAPLPAELQQAMLAAMSEDPSRESPAAPRQAPLLALRNALLTVGTVAPLNIGRPESLAAIEAARQGDQWLAVFAQKDELNAAPGASDLYDVGCLVKLVSTVAMAERGQWLVVRAAHWVRLDAVERAEGYSLARVSPFVVDDKHTAETTQLELALRAAVRTRAAQLPDPAGILRMTERMNALQLADSVVANLHCSVAEKARYASEASLAERLSYALELLASAA